MLLSIINEVKVTPQDHHILDNFPITECIQVFYSLLIQYIMINQAGHALLLYHKLKSTFLIMNNKDTVFFEQPHMSELMTVTLYVPSLTIIAVCQDDHLGTGKAGSHLTSHGHA